MTKPKPIDLDGLVREAEEKAHAGCPNALCAFGDSERARKNRLCGWTSCGQTDHAAIARAVRIAELVGRVRQAEKMHAIDCDCHDVVDCDKKWVKCRGKTHPVTDTVCQSERDHLRDELRRAVEE